MKNSIETKKLSDFNLFSSDFNGFLKKISQEDGF